MTTYILQGVRQDWDLNDNVTAMTSSQMEIVLDGRSDGTFSYTIDSGNSGDLPDVEITADAMVHARIDGSSIIDGPTAQIGKVVWNGNTTFLLAFTNDPPPGVPTTDWYFVLGGAPLPDFASASDPVQAFMDFESTITKVGPINSGPYSAGKSISFDGLPNMTSTEDDRILGTGIDDVFSGGIGRDLIQGKGGNDILKGDAGKDDIRGGSGKDTVKGGGGNDKLSGDGGRDKIDGGSGSDNMKGGGGNDQMNGGGGKDKLNGGGGNDDMAGGGGADTFIFSKGDDQITDFFPVDRINLKSVDSITGFKDLKNNHTEDVNGNLVIDDGAGNTLTLIGVTEASLTSDSFLF